MSHEPQNTVSPKTIEQVYQPMNRRTFLKGTAAAMVGLADRIQAELRKEGRESAVVHRVKEPRNILAFGALKSALLTPDDRWEIPLFNFRSAV